MTLEEEFKHLVEAANKVGVKDTTVVGQEKIYKYGMIGIFQDYGSPGEGLDKPKYEGVAFVVPGPPGAVYRVTIGECGYPTVDGVTYCRMFFPTSAATYARQFADTHKGPFRYELSHPVEVRAP